MSCCCSLAMSPLGLTLELEMRWPSGTRIPFTMPPSATAPANTLQRSMVRDMWRVMCGMARSADGQLVSLSKATSAAVAAGVAAVAAAAPVSPEAAAPHRLGHFRHLQAVPKVGLVYGRVVVGGQSSSRQHIVSPHATSGIPPLQSSPYFLPGHPPEAYLPIASA